MHLYRTHNCGELTINDVDQEVKLSGWVHRRRDHGSLVFIDLRDHYGITQCVIDGEHSNLVDEISHIRYETVITLTGKVVARNQENINKEQITGEIEIYISNYTIESASTTLPLQVNDDDKDFPEDIRLKYRFLDLRKEKLHQNIILRSQVISHIRNQMSSLGFLEMQTPILTASSPEGARDYLVPSRIHQGKFYALPQAPQIFKQLLMVSGFDKYFQIAPCFRDEDARADRSPGEFYQLDMEMSFVTQEDVFNVMEPVLKETFKKFSNKVVEDKPFARIKYSDSMLKYGTDKPDLRIPITISECSDIFLNSNFTIFKNNIQKGSIVRAIPAPKTASKSRSFFDKMISYAQENGAKGLAYIIYDENGDAKGPIAKLLSQDQHKQIMELTSAKPGDSIFFTCDNKQNVEKISGLVRIKLGQDLNLIDKNIFKFCWITDFPYFEYDYDNKKIDFSHNPFSMPQGGLEALTNAKSEEELLSILAYQYDIVCNGVELSSGAIRNHKLEILYKAFEIVGFNKEYVQEKYRSLVNAFQYGAPPHGGIAPGIDRIVMLLADEPNIREVICFPLNQQAQDLMMNAPSTVDPKAQKELGLQIKINKK